jgi:UDP-N-acetyl-D-mannosaminuronate dehydrogenase
MFNLRKCRIGVVGLGYVGLPLAVEFGRHFETVGFDIKATRISELKAERDSTLEASKSELAAARLLSYTTNPAELRRCRVDVVRELQKYGSQVDVYDPWADAPGCKHEYGIRPVRSLAPQRYDAAIVAVAHREFRELGADGVHGLCRKNHVLYDIKHVFKTHEVDGRL